MCLLNYGKHVVKEEFALLIVNHAVGRGVVAVLGKLFGDLNECVRQAPGGGNARVNERGASSAGRTAKNTRKKRRLIEAPK